MTVLYPPKVHATAAYYDVMMVGNITPKVLRLLIT